jgi:hypothetical protein
MRTLRIIVGTVGGALAGALAGGVLGALVFLYLLGADDTAYPLVFWVPVGIGALAWAVYAGVINAKPDSEVGGYGGPYYTHGSVEWQLDQIRRNTEPPPKYRG